MRSSSLFALLLALPALSACPKDVPLPTEGAIRSARLETVITVRDHRFASPAGAGLGRSLLAPAMDPAIAKTYGFTPPATPAVEGGKPVVGFYKGMMDAMLSSGIAKKVDDAFLAATAGKLSYTIKKEDEDPDAIVELELAVKRLVPPTADAPARIELRVLLRLSSVGADESALEREETLLRDAPELGNDPATWLEDPAKVTAALTAAAEDAAKAAAGWLVEATLAKDPPAAPATP